MKNNRSSQKPLNQNIHYTYNNSQGEDEYLEESDEYIQKEQEEEEYDDNQEEEEPGQFNFYQMASQNLPNNDQREINDYYISNEAKYSSKYIKFAYQKAYLQNYEVQQLEDELNQWQGTVIDIYKFRESRMEGYMRKFVEKVKVFQKILYPKRYFIIDFKLAVLLIQQDENGNQKNNQKEISFKNITDIYHPQGGMNNDLKLQKNWENCFYLQTKERVFCLFCKTENQKNMWMSGFKYIIATTKILSEIQNSENEDIDYQDYQDKALNIQDQQQSQDQRTEGAYDCYMPNTIKYLPKHVKQQYESAIMNNQKTQSIEEELHQWQGTAESIYKFKEAKMEGYIRKFVEQVKLFQKLLYPKRYFIINFTTGILQIKQDEKTTDQSKIKEFPFKNIRNVYLPVKDMTNNNIKLQKNWEQCFYLETPERTFILFCKTEDQRNMWMCGFKYIVATNRILNQVLNDKEGSPYQSPDQQQNNQLIQSSDSKAYQGGQIIDQYIPNLAKFQPVDIKQQYHRAFMESNVVQELQEELHTWQGTAKDIYKFKEQRMEGYMRKFVEQVKVFQKNLYPKRYFIIDFEQGILIIQQNEQTTDEKKIKKITFQHIQNVYPADEDSKKNAKLNTNWEICFFLQTQERLFCLFCKNEEQQKMWMCGFKYIIESTQILNNVLSFNGGDLNYQNQQRPTIIRDRSPQSVEERLQELKDYDDKHLKNLQLQINQEENKTIEGYIQKKGQTKTLSLTNTFMSRYLVIDLSLSRIIFKYKKEYTYVSANSKILKYSDIKECYIPSEQETNINRNTNNMEFIYPFVLQTNDRTSYLYTSSEQEREIWVKAFAYVIAHNKQGLMTSVINNQGRKYTNGQFNDSIDDNNDDQQEEEKEQINNLNKSKADSSSILLQQKNNQNYQLEQRLTRNKQYQSQTIEDKLDELKEIDDSKFVNLKIQLLSQDFRTIEGYIEKKGQAKSLSLTNTFMKRYLVIDLSLSRIIYKHKKEYTYVSANSKILKYDQIKSCYLPSQDQQSKNRNTNSNEFIYSFILETKERSQFLYTSSEQERDIWIKAFNYVIAHNKQGMMTSVINNQGRNYNNGQLTNIESEDNNSNYGEIEQNQNDEQIQKDNKQLNDIIQSIDQAKNFLEQYEGDQSIDIIIAMDQQSEGYIQKKVQKYQGSGFRNRYLIIDFQIMQVIFKHKREDTIENENNKIIKFRDIKECISNNNKEKNINFNKECPFHWTIKTTERDYVLYTNTQINKNIWTQLFSLVINLTQKEQCTQQIKDQQQKQALLENTRALNRQASLQSIGKQTNAKKQNFTKNDDVEIIEDKNANKQLILKFNSLGQKKVKLRKSSRGVEQANQHYNQLEQAIQSQNNSVNYDEYKNNFSFNSNNENLPMQNKVKSNTKKLILEQLDKIKRQQQILSKQKEASVERLERLKDNLAKRTSQSQSQLNILNQSYQNIGYNYTEQYSRRQDSAQRYKVPTLQTQSNYNSNKIPLRNQQNISEMTLNTLSKIDSLIGIQNNLNDKEPQQERKHTLNIPRPKGDKKVRLKMTKNLLYIKEQQAGKYASNAEIPSDSRVNSLQQSRREEDNNGQRRKVQWRSNQRQQESRENNDESSYYPQSQKQNQKYFNERRFSNSERKDVFDVDGLEGL